MYDGTYTAPDPNLTAVATLKDGRKVWILHDDSAEAPYDEGCSIHMQDNYWRSSRYIDSSLDGLISRLSGEVDEEKAAVRAFRMIYGRYAYPVYLQGNQHEYVILDNPSEFGNPEAAAKALARDWRHYFEGDCYGFIVTDDAGNEDSLWGFLGDCDESLVALMGESSELWTADDVEEMEYR